MSAPARPDEGWVLDRHIPIAVIVALVVQTIGVVWWAATLSARVDALEMRVLADADVKTRIVRIEALLDRIERRIDAAAGNGYRPANPPAGAGP